MEGYQQSKIERNIEQDKRVFVEAISNASIEEIQTEFDEQSVTTLTASINKTKLFILGEAHGVKENASIVYTFFKKFGFKNLALEWDEKSQTVAERLLETGELDFDAIKDSPDGRITPEHFALLRKLKNEGLLEKIICFDWGNRRNERDVNMATNILKNVSDQSTLVMAGSVHTAVEPQDSEQGEDTYHPMGELIKKEVPNIASGTIEYLSGQHYNYGVQNMIDDTDGPVPSKARFYQTGESIYLYELPVAHASTVPDSHTKL